MTDEKINVWGARVHNLKNIDVEIPRNSLTVITGLSGSGKSSLAFDTIYAEGQRRYIETFSAYARNFLGGMERPDVDKITGLSPVISIEQKTTNKNPRSTVGTTTEIYDYLRLLYARAGIAYSYATGEEMVKYTEEDVLKMIHERYSGKLIYILAPLVRNRKGHYRELFESMRRKGYLYIRVDGELKEITRGMKTDRYKNHNIEVVVDKLKVQDKDDERLKKSVSSAMKQGDGLLLIIFTLYIFPVIATFANTLGALCRNAFLLAFMHFPTTIAIAVITIFPLYMTYLDAKLQPLYACCWFFFGFGLVAFINSMLLYRFFKKLLPPEEDISLL